MSDSSKLHYAEPWWCRPSWLLPIQFILLLISLLIFFNLAGAEPFLIPKASQLWTFVAVPAVVGWTYLQMTLGLAHALVTTKERRISHVIVIVLSIGMAYMVLKIPSEYAIDLIKNNQLWAELKCKGGR